MRARIPGDRMQLALSAYASAVFAFMWLGFLYAIWSSPGSLEDAWNGFRGLPSLPQAAVSVLFLPVVVGLWAWHSDLPDVAIVVAGVGLVVWTFLALGSLTRATRRPL